MTKRLDSIGNPVRDGNQWVFPDGTRVPYIAGGDDGVVEPPADPPADDPAADPDAEDTIEVPENLSDRDAVTDEALAELEAQLVAEFDRRFDAGDRDVAGMTALADAIQACSDEQDARAAKDAEDAEKLAEQAARVRAIQAGPEPEPEPGDGDPDDGDPQPDPEPEPEPQDAGATPEPVLASGSVRRGGAKPSARAIKRTATPPVPPAKPASELVSITAAAEVPGYSSNQQMSIADVAKGLHERARGLPNHSLPVKVAIINRPNLPMASENDAAGVTQLLDSLVAAGTAQGAQGLVAAGGWCLPSQTYLEFFAIEGTGAMFDLPTIGVDGGGLMVPDFIGFDAADQALWTWTEDTDEIALNGAPLANMALTANVLTVDTTGAHQLSVGDRVTIVTSTAAFADINGQTVTVASVTDEDTFTAAFTHANIASAAATGTATPTKPCMRIPCPSWTDYRLEADGLCITHGNLTDRAFPQLGQRYVNLAMAAHERRMRARALAKVIATIEAGDQIVITDVGSDSAGEVLGAIDLAAAAYREQYGMDPDAVLETVWPLWTRENVRAAMARRAGNGVEAVDVSNADVTRWFTNRNIRPQFVLDFQPIYDGATIPLAWPATLDFLMYPAGGYFLGTGGEINLGAQRDSVLNATNDFTLAWSEEFSLVGQRGPTARQVTVALNVDGVTACCPAA